jgi:hypothetical protein
MPTNHCAVGRMHSRRNADAHRSNHSIQSQITAKIMKFAPDKLFSKERGKFCEHCTSFDISSETEEEREVRQWAGENSYRVQLHYTNRE